MLTLRRHRLLTAFLVVMALVFSQLAQAGYVCPQQAGSPAMAGMAASGLPCQGMDPAQPALCHQHCADAAQAFEASTPFTAVLPAIVQVLELPLLLAVAVDCAVPATAQWQAQPPPAPVFLATLRLRV
jgi:hypothetical protein